MCTLKSTPIRLYYMIPILSMQPQSLCSPMHAHRAMPVPPIDFISIPIRTGKGTD